MGVENGGCDGKRKCTSTRGVATCGNCRAPFINDGATGCKNPALKKDPCKTNNGGCHSKRKCTSTNGRVTCGNCPAGYVNNGVNSCSEVVDRCKKNNGGCHGKRKCTSTNGKVTCGNCPAGYANDGAKGCKAAAAEEECKIIGTMHGKHVTTFTNLVGYTGCKGQPGLHILIHHDGGKHYKMVGINIKDAKASSTPKAIAKYVTAGKGSVKLTNENVCKMFKGEGYSPKVYDYEAKDVTVVCGGSPSADAP